MKPPRRTAPRHAAPSRITPSPRAPSPGAPPSDPLEVVYGHRASLAVLAKRPDAIVEALVSPASRREAEPLVRALRARVRELPDGQLARVAGTEHHEGIVLRTTPRKWASGKELRALLDPERPEAVHRVAVALDRVRNPYNIGAILRSAAFFGIDAAILGAPAPHPALPPDAARVAEGGAEHLVLSRTTDLAETLARLREQGVFVYGAENDGALDAIGLAFHRPCVLVLGHEREGISERVRAQCHAMVAIRGTGTIDSLNVSIAASLLIAELVRSRGPSMGHR
jgi:TrmH RNA methyltransferase